VRIDEHLNINNQDVKSRRVAGPIKKTLISEKETAISFF
jgi:hypothetical protein